MLLIMFSQLHLIQMHFQISLALGVPCNDLIMSKDLELPINKFFDLVVYVNIIVHG
jgi:hypothetical protein